MGETPVPAPLLAVTLLFRSKRGFSDVPHMISAISELLDASVELPLNVACKKNSIQLLDRIWASSDIFVNNPNANITRTPWTLRKYIRTDKHYRQYQFSLSMEEAVALKNLEMVKWLAARFQGCELRGRLVSQAALKGCFEMLQFFHKCDNSSTNGVQDVGLRVDWSGDCILNAVSSQRCDVVWWLLEHVPTDLFDIDRTMRLAVNTCNIPLAEWLLRLGARMPTNREGLQLAHSAAAQGRLDVLQWLEKKGQVDGLIGLVVTAAERGELDVVQWVIDRDARREDGVHLTDLGGEVSLAVHSAAVKGHLEVAKYLRARAKKPRDELQRAVEVVKQHRNRGKLLEQLGHFDKSGMVSGKTMFETARSGHLAVVQWLYTEYGEDPDVNLFEEDPSIYWGSRSAIDAAASHGHLGVVKYLHELQVELDSSARKRKRGAQSKKISPKCTEEAMNGAAKNGHLEVVQWLHQNRTEGCTTKAMDEAAHYGHLPVVKWLHEHRSEGCTPAAMDQAAQNGHLEVVQWLHNHSDAGCTTAALNEAACFGFLDIMKWLHTNRAEGCTTDAMDGAAENGIVDILKWLHANRTEGCTQLAMTNAARVGSLDVVQLLHLHRSECDATAAVIDAAGSNQFEIFLYLQDVLHAQCTQEDADEAAANSAPEIHAWILERYPEYESTE